MHQQIAKENLQVMEWINCMKSVCRIESKWYVIHNVTVATAIATVAIAIIIANYSFNSLLILKH